MIEDWIDGIANMAIVNVNDGIKGLHQDEEILVYGRALALLGVKMVSEVGGEDSATRLLNDLANGDLPVELNVTDMDLH